MSASGRDVIKRQAIYITALLMAIVGGVWIGYELKRPPVEWDIKMTGTLGGVNYPMAAFREVNAEMDAKIESLFGKHAGDIYHVIVVPDLGGYKIRAAAGSQSAFHCAGTRDQLIGWISQRMDELQLEQQREISDINHADKHGERAWWITLKIGSPVSTKFEVWIHSSGHFELLRKHPDEHQFTSLEKGRLPEDEVTNLIELTRTTIEAFEYPHTDDPDVIDGINVRLELSTSYTEASVGVRSVASPERGGHAVRLIVKTINSVIENQEHHIYPTNSR